MNIFSTVGQAIIRAVSKNNRKKTLALVSVAIVACGLLIGCPEPAATGGGNNGGGGGNAPNLAITAVLAPTSVAPGGTATVTVTVTNSGTAASPETMVDFYRSTDATIDTSDMKIDGAAQMVPSILANETRTATYTIPATMTADAGTLYFGACIPRSSGATCSTALTLLVTNTAVPDLSVQTPPTLPQASYTTGTSATISVVVTNSGNAASTDGTVTFYRQAGAAPAPASDTRVGTHTLSAIAAGENETATATFNTGAEGQAMYYAVVSGATGDAIETNNTSPPTAAIAITAALPDLTITSFTSSTSTVIAAGGTLTANVTVQNAGGANAAATRVSFELVPGGEGATPIALAETVSIDAINAGTEGTGTGTITIPAETAVGAYQVRATVAAVENEANRDNNTLVLGGDTPVNITISATPAPDLDVSGVIPTLGETSYTTGTSATISVVVTNSGSADSTDGTVTFYRQTGAAPVPASDTAVGTHTLAAITAGERETATADFNTGAVGMATYYAVVSGATGDATTINNTSAPTAAIAINAVTAPDLTVAKPTITGTTPYVEGGEITLSVVVTNNGTADSTDGMVTFYREEGVIDEIIGTAQTLPAITAGASAPATTITYTLTDADAGTGTAYYAQITDVTGETAIGNNDSVASDGIDVTALAPDLTIAAPTVSSAASYVAGDSVTLTAVVTNSSTANEASTDGTVTFYRSDGAGSGTQVGAVQTLSNTGIAIGASETVTVTFNLGTAGTNVQYYATISGVTGETATDNNESTLSTPAITITASTIDLTAAKPTVTGTTPYVTGGEITLSSVITNGGTTGSTDGTVTFYREDGVNDVIVGTAQTLDAIAPSATATATTTHTLLAADIGTGVQFYAEISGVTGETATGNNTSVASDGEDIAALAPNLEITAFTSTSTSVPVSGGPDSGRTFDISLTVGNTGTAQSVARTLSAVLQPTTGRGAVTLSVSSGEDVAPINAGDSEDITATVVVPAGMAVVGTTYNLRVSILDPLNPLAGGISATLESGGTPTEFTITDAIGPELTVAKPTVSPAASYVAGNSVTLSAVVSNSSAANAASTDGMLTFYRSDGAGSGTIVGTAQTIPGIAIGASAPAITVDINLGATGTNVQYYAVISDVNDETDTSNNTSDLSDGIDIAASTIDLIAGKPTVTAGTTFTEGQTITLSSVITNQGTTGSSDGTVTFYREDGVTDVMVGEAQDLSTIAASGGTQTVTTTHTLLAADAGTGIQFYAEITGVTGETADGNNASVPSDGEDIAALGPDLTVAAPTLSGTAPYVTGTSRTLSAVVTNEGNVTSTNGTVTFYRSDGAGSGTQVGTPHTFTSAITASGGTATATADITLGAVENGVEYYAVITAVTDETDTDNNTSDSSTAINIVARTIDLDVSAAQVTISAGTPPYVEGDTETLSVVVTNDGNTGSTDGTVIFYRQVSGSADIEVGTRFGLGEIDADGNATATTSITLGSEGTDVQYYAVVSAVTGETNTDNNRSELSDGITLRALGPDLDFTTFTSTATSSPVSGPESSRTFTIELAITNTGTQASPAGTLSVGLRPAAGGGSNILLTLTPATVNVPSIPVGTARSITATATVPAGRAIVGTTYNLHAGIAAPPPSFFAYSEVLGGDTPTPFTITAALAPDLDIGTTVPVTISGRAPYTEGDTETLSVIVTNNGNTASAATGNTVTFYRGALGFGTAVGTPFTLGTIGHESGSNTATATTSITFGDADVGTGVQYYAEIRGASSGTDVPENTSALSTGIDIIELGSDLTVAAPTVSAAASYVAGDSVTLTAVVTNSNTANAASTNGTVTFYREGGASDTQVGAVQTLSNTGIAIGATETVTVTFNLGAAGTNVQYYAEITGVTDETDTDNNESALSTPAITIDASTIDLIAAKPTVTTVTTFTEGQTITLSSVITNNGTTGSSDGTVTFYREDGVTDVMVGTAQTLLGIAARGTQTVTTTHTLLAADAGIGVQFYAEITGVAGETATGNNTSAPSDGTTIVVLAPDLDLSGVRVTLDEASYSVSGVAEISVVVSNTGNAPSTVGARVRFFRQLTGTPDTDNDTVVATENNVPAIAAGGSTPVSEFFNVSNTAATGVLYYAVIDRVANDSDATNNRSQTSNAIAITSPPDIDITTFTPSATTVTSGESFTVDVVVTNIGGQQSEAATITFQLIDSRGTPEPTFTTSVDITVPQLAGGANTGTLTSAAITVPETVPLGTYMLRAVASNTASEPAARRDNNTEVVQNFVIAPTPPDLDISGVQTTLDAATYTVGDTATISVVVSNTGNTDSTVGATLSFYRADGAVIDRTADGGPIATTSVPAITGGTSQPVSTTFTASDADTGILYYAIITAVANETDRDDNTSQLSNAITINDPVDLSITTFSTSATTVSKGDDFTATVVVSNSGDIESETAQVAFELVTSGGTVQTTFTETINVPAVAGGTATGMLTSGAITVGQTVPFGTYTLRATLSRPSNEAVAQGNNNTATVANFTITATSLEIDTEQVMLDETEYVVGETVTISVDVNNEGNVASSDGRVRFYRQTGTNPVLTDDTLVATANTLSAIPANGSATATATFAASNPDTGIVYYAVLDNVTGDDDTTDNMSLVSDTIDIAARTIDLEITAFTSPATSVSAGGSLSASVTVRNIGNVESDPTTMSFALVDSSDSSTVVDLGGTPPSVAELAANASTSVTATNITVPANTPAGTYHLRATVEPVLVTNEPNTANNTRVLGGSGTETEITIPAGDLEITAFTTTDTTVSAGDTLNASLTVRNSGGAAIATPSVSIALVNSGGTVVGNALGSLPIGALNAGAMQATDGMITIPANTAAGTYRLRATVSGDSNTANNERDLATTFVIPVGDLEITAFSTNGTSVSPGDDFTATVTVENSGGSATAATTVSFELVPSGGAAIALTGTVAIDALNAGEDDEDKAGTITVPSGTAAGDYQLRATVASVSSETNTNNAFLLGGNTPTTFTISTTAVPDLEITAFTTTGGRTSAAVGSSVQANITVRNAGNAATTAAASVSFALVPSVGAAIPLTGTVSISALAFGVNNTDTGSGTITVPAGTATGDYQLRATVSTATGETSTANNALLLGGNTSPTTFTVLSSGPELEVTAFTLAVTEVVRGGDISPSVTIRNNGNVASATTSLSFALVPSVGSAIPLTGTVAVGAINAGASDTDTGPVTVPVGTAPGTYQLRATIASVSGETDTTNNDFLLGGASPTSITITAPDLVITAFTIAGTAAVAPGGTFEPTVTIRNIGNARSVATSVSFELLDSGGTVLAALPDADVTSVPAGSVPVGRITGGNQLMRSAVLTIPASTAAGSTYQVRATVASVTAESNTTNNTRLFSNFTVNPPGPDLVITSILPSSTSVAAGGNTGLIRVIVTNNGSAQSAAAVVSLDIVDNSGTVIARLGNTLNNTGQIGQGGDSTVGGTFTVPVGTTPGTYRLRATVATVANEIDTTNNTRLLGGDAMPTDFVVTN